MGYTHHNRFDGAPDPDALWTMLDTMRGYLPFPLQDPRESRQSRPTGPSRSERPRVSVHALVLGVLADGPRHGGQIVREIAAQDDSSEAPGAAEIYPELQLLVDDGLATVAETDGRRTFTLTQEGRDEAAAAGDTDADAVAPWDGLSRLFEGRGELPKAGVKLGQAVHQVGIGGSEDQRRRATALLDEARRRIYGILAEETEETEEADGAADA